MSVVLFVTLAIRFAEPIRDGDFFWHAKYGEYCIEHKTLIPDHTIWSWTPADGKAIKCNWIADIFVYFLKEIGGFPLLFAFRYFCMALLLIIIWMYAFKTGEGSRIHTPLILIIVLLGSFAAAYIKTEIFSMLFMAAIPAIYFSVKSSLFKKWDSKIFYIYPVLILIWANTHKVFLFGLMLMASIIIGELINYKFAKSSALSPSQIKDLIKSGIFSFSATLITPYGWRADFQYIKMFLDNFLNKKMELGLQVISQYTNIFAIGSSILHFIELWILMSVSFSVLFVMFKAKCKKWDWGIFIPMVVISIISARYLRAFYFMCPFWAMAVLYMISSLRAGADSFNKRNKPIKPLFVILFLSLFLFLSARSMWEAKYRPFMGRWLGFGIGGFNPVQASEFLKNHKPGHLLYNSYNVGGYLIYDLYPTYKVFCDPRYFPYRSWYEEYWNFNNGQTPLNGFNKKYPFDVAIVDYVSSESPIMKFLRSKEWRPVFYGPVAMVFVKNSSGFKYDYKKLDPHRFDNIKNFIQIYNAYFVAINLLDYEASRHIIDTTKKNFKGYPGYGNVIEKMEDCQKSLMAYLKKDYDLSLKILEQIGDEDIILLFKLRNRKAKELIGNGKFKKALSYLEANLMRYPTYADGLYNAGVIAYQVELMERRKNPGAYSSDNFLNPGGKSRFYLERFLKLAPNHRHAWVAKQILEGGGMPPHVTLAL